MRSDRVKHLLSNNIQYYSFIVLDLTLDFMSSFYQKPLNWEFKRKFHSLNKGFSLGIAHFEISAQFVAHTLKIAVYIVRITNQLTYVIGIMFKHIENGGPLKHNFFTEKVKDKFYYDVFFESFPGSKDAF